jgi:hypothetical protein
MAHNSTPQTISDFIKLLTAAKEQYGDLKVRRVHDCDVHNEDEYYEFEDVVVTAAPKSLIRDNAYSDSETYFLFVV